MTDNLGLNQTRVLDSSNRSFEAVIFQKKKPPLSCEWNLEGNLVAGHSQDVSQLVGPSGWVSVGSINANATESTARVGDVITSPNYPANSFKLMATDQGILTGTLVAWVNGMKVVVQGTRPSTDENNLVQLLSPPTISSRVDFVFLEVWRKLIGISDVVYTHGNVCYGGVNYINDLVDPAVNIETSLRIQVQYRIRVASDVDIESFPDGFGPNVYAQGPLMSPSNCTGSNFVQVPGDPGLWRAGLGDSAAQESLNTVDGFTYAIPMFAVCRRNTSAFSPDFHTNGAGHTLQDYLNGTASDRPDNLYSDWIVTDDILDMRKTIKVDNLRDKCNEAFRKLTTGKLRGKMEYQTTGEDRFGVLPMEIDGISQLNPGWYNRIAQGTSDSVSGLFVGTFTGGGRRVFSNAGGVQQRRTLIQVFPAGSWTPDPIIISPSLLDPTGTAITEILAIWGPNTSSTLQTFSLGSDYSYTIVSGSVEIYPLPHGGLIEGSSTPLTISYLVQYPYGNNVNGLFYVPEKVLESRRIDSTVAFPATAQSNFQIHGSTPLIAPDGTFINTIANRGVEPTSLYDFGIQMTYNILGNGTSTILIPRNIWGYEILGVVSVYAPSTGIYKSIISVNRTISTYTINYGGVVISNTQTVQLVLYVGASNVQPGAVSKFFETNKQGRAIVDTYQMKELPAFAITPTSFFVDATNVEIRALASGALLGSGIAGVGIAYDNAGNMITTIQQVNASLPMPITISPPGQDSTCSRVYFDFASSPAQPVSVPVLVSSAVADNESYQIYYQRVPYQGLLDSTTYGTIEAEGPAIVTTSGSSSITNFTYSAGNASFNGSSVTGSNTGWSANAKPGYLISSGSQSNKFYEILSVNSNISLTIKGDAGIIGSGPYTITARNVPSFSPANIVDRMPVLDFDSDDIIQNEIISTSISDPYPVIETRIISRPQDIIDAPADSAQIGVYSAARGRCVIHVSDSSSALGQGNLGLKFERMSASINGHAKTYQAYVLNKESKGELYLMVVGSESDNASQSRQFIPGYTIPQDRDVVDIFQIPGRPIKNGKNI